MKIKLAILENDSDYLNRIVPALNAKFSNDLEIYTFTDVSNAINCLTEKNINVFLSNNIFSIDFSKIPSKCSFAYLVDNIDIDYIDNYKAICKFQRVDVIYKQILNIYSEQIPNNTSFCNNENDSMKTIVFTSPCGGVGTSTAAAACAIAISNMGYRVIYINATIYGSADSFFSADGQYNFSDVIYAIKSNKTNRSMKLQSSVKQDATGVYFYSSTKVPLDMMEMKLNDYITLQSELKTIGQYDYVVMDLDFPKTQQDLEFLKYCNSIVLISDESETSKTAISRFMRVAEILDSQDNYSILYRMWLLKNKLIYNDISQNDIRILGTIPLYQTASPLLMAKQLSSMNLVFGQLI